MELRHLRYFQAVAEALNFTKAAAQLRVAQPALSRQVQDLEEEIGVELLRRSPRGVTLTAAGKLFLAEVRELLGRTDDAVEKVRALARGEYGVLHVGYAPSPSVEILPPAIAAFQRIAPQVKVVLHDLSEDEMTAGLLDGSLELAIDVEQTADAPPGIGFEELMRYPFCVAMATGHPLAGRKALTIAEIATQPLVGLRRDGYAEYHRVLDRLFAPLSDKPRLAVECDGSASVTTAVEVGSHLSVVSHLFRHIAGSRLIYRPIADSQVSHGIGIARATRGEVTPAGEKFCEMLRTAALRLKPRPDGKKERARDPGGPA